MTSVSSTGWGTGIQSLLQKQVTSGAIPQGDQSALSSAINDIGGALKSGTPASGSIQDRVSGLIDNEVSSGKLTGDQASELKGLFAKAHGHMHHVHAGGGGASSALNDLLSPDGTTNADGTTSTDGTTTTASTDPLTGAANGAHSVIDGLASFVSSLRSAVSSNSLYGAGGSTAGRIGSVLINSFA